MNVARLNRPLFDLEKDHPARQFLEAFIECRKNCVGREIPYSDSTLPPIDQEWFSAIDRRRWTFSSFAYQFLSFDVVLDGWLRQVPQRTRAEEADLKHLPRLRELMAECRNACVAENNVPVLSLADQVLDVLDLWERCILARPLADSQAESEA